MKAKLFFADKYRLAETPQRDFMALKILDLLERRYYNFGNDNFEIKGSEIMKVLGISTGAQLRTMILYARTNIQRLIPLMDEKHMFRKTFMIIADSKGYRLSDNPAQLREYRDALHTRAVHGIMVVQAINETLNEKDDNELAG